MKKLIAILILAALVGGGKYYWDKKQAPASEAAPKTKLGQVKRGSIMVQISTSGKVVSNLDVEIKCKASGEVMALPFDVSDSVKKGDLLLELNPEDEERRVKQEQISASASQARYTQAKENLQLAKSNLVLAKKRAEATLIATRAKEQDVQAQLSQLVEKKNLALEIKRAEAGLTSAKAHALDTKLKAERVGQLLAKKLSSKEDYETAETAAIRAEVDLKLAQIRLEQLNVDELALAEQLETAKVNAIKALTDLDLAKITIEALAIDEQALVLKEEDVQLAAAAVELDLIALSDAKQRLEDTRVLAPMAGVVSASNVQIGQIISSAISNVGGGTTVLTLSDLSQLFVLASVDESDISRIRVGQSVLIRTDAYQGKKFQGEVERIATRGVNVSNVITFEVKIKVLGENKSLLKPEMTTNADIIVAKKDDVLLVPVEAILQNDESKVIETAKEDHSTEKKEVELGISDGVQTEIISGVEEGEHIILQNAEAHSLWRNPKKSQNSNTARRSTRGLMRAVH